MLLAQRNKRFQLFSSDPALEVLWEIIDKRIACECKHEMNTKSNQPSMISCFRFGSSPSTSGIAAILFPVLSAHHSAAMSHTAEIEPFQVDEC
jgi:hypothetical protein